MKRLAFFCCFLFLFFREAVYSHPHVFIDNLLKVSATSAHLKEVRVIWKFDAFFSSNIIMQFDVNRNNRFETNEIESVRKGAFQNLKNFNYFTFIEINGKSHKIAAVHNFSASIAGNRLIYEFSVVINAAIKPAAGKISVWIFDPTNYVAFGDPNPAHVVFTGKKPARSNVKIENRKYVISY